MFDELVGKVADSTNRPWDEHSYVPVVELLDRQPVLFRQGIGLKTVEKFQALVRERNPQGFLARDSLGSDRFVFLYDLERAEDPDDYDPMHLAELEAYGTLRHTEALEAGEPDDSVTLAVGVLHHDDLGRRTAFAYLLGPTKPLPPDLRYRSRPTMACSASVAGSVSRGSLGGMISARAGAGESTKRATFDRGSGP